MAVEVMSELPRVQSLLTYAGGSAARIASQRQAEPMTLNFFVLPGSREHESRGARWEPHFPAVERGPPCRGWPYNRLCEKLQLPFRGPGLFSQRFVDFH